MIRQLVIDAFVRAVKKRNPSKELIFHSDFGSQYVSNDFQNTLLKHDMKASMSHKGDC